MQINRPELNRQMESAGLRAVDLAVRSGVSESFVGELRRGVKTEASEAVVKSLADVLDVDVHTIATSSVMEVA